MAAEVKIKFDKTEAKKGDLVEVKSNLKAGEKIVTRGSLFIDRAATGS